MSKSLVGLEGIELLQSGAEVVEELEHKLSSLFQWYDRSHIINRYSILKHLLKKNGPWPNHTVARLMCAACQYGVDNGRLLSDSALIDAINVVGNTPSPSYHVVLSSPKTVELFGQLIERDQFPFQEVVTKRDIGRAIWLYRYLIHDKSKDWLSGKFGTRVDRAFFVAAITAHMFDDGKQNLLFDGNSLASALQAGYLIQDVMSVLRNCSASVDVIGAMCDQQYADTKNKAFLWAGKSPLTRYPIIELCKGVYRSPFPNMIFSAFYRKVGDVVRSSDQHAANFGEAFARYIELVIDDLSPLNLVYPDKHGHADARCDFKAVFAGYNLYVESKATRFSRKIINQQTIQSDTSTGEIASACVQLAKSAEMDTGKKVGVVVIDDDLWFANSKWYRSRVIGRNKDVKQAVRCFGYFPSVWSVDTFERVIAVSLNTGKGVDELIGEFESDDYNRYGDWPSWLGHRYRGVNSNKLDWISGGVSGLLESM